MPDVDYSMYEYSIESDDDFYDCMENYGQDIVDIFEELRPYWRVEYEQDGQAGNYINTFIVTTDFGDFEIRIKDNDLVDYYNYSDILEDTVKKILYEVEEA